MENHSGRSLNSNTVIYSSYNNRIFSLYSNECYIVMGSYYWPILQIDYSSHACRIQGKKKFVDFQKIVRSRETQENLMEDFVTIFVFGTHLITNKIVVVGVDPVEILRRPLSPFQHSCRGTQNVNANRNKISLIIL